jgi:hypothetical protein
LNQTIHPLPLYTKNNGYLFSNVNAVEVKTANDTIDFLKYELQKVQLLTSKVPREMTKQMTE